MVSMAAVVSPTPTPTTAAIAARAAGFTLTRPTFHWMSTSRCCSRCPAGGGSAGSGPSARWTRPGPSSCQCTSLPGPRSWRKPATRPRSAPRGATAWWPRRCAGNAGCSARATRSAPSVAALGDPQVREFLSYGTRTGKLAYLAPSGRPLVAPVWFIVEGDSLVFNTGSQTAKGRALARNPRATLCVDLEEPPYGFVQVQGDAELSEDPAELLRTATAIGARYMGAERADEFGKRNSVPGELVVRLRPVKVVAGFDINS